VADVRIGTSGWSYTHWRSTVYPPGLAAPRQLAWLAAHLNSVEVNASFYALQTPSTYQAWYDQTPRDFLFAVKGSRFITHNKKLKDAEQPLANFLASGVLLLADKLGPIVWQLSRTARFDPQRLESFLALLPRTVADAVALARRHDARVAEARWPATFQARRVRHALEVRSASFLTPQLATVARRYNVALAVSDAADWPAFEEPTADFMYARLHGHTHTYASRYRRDALESWAQRILAWRAGRESGGAQRLTSRSATRAAGRDVYVYFDNDFRGYAALNAMDLQRLLTAPQPKTKPRALA
jgi:uncharacterized protein YecE (DUF72 family)